MKRPRLLVFLSWLLIISNSSYALPPLEQPEYKGRSFDAIVKEFHPAGVTRLGAFAHQGDAYVTYEMPIKRDSTYLIVLKNDVLYYAKAQNCYYQSKISYWNQVGDGGLPYEVGTDKIYQSFLEWMKDIDTGVNACREEMAKNPSKRSNPYTAPFELIGGILYVAPYIALAAVMSPFVIIIYGAQRKWDSKVSKIEIDLDEKTVIDYLGNPLWKLQSKEKNYNILWYENHDFGSEFYLGMRDGKVEWFYAGTPELRKRVVKISCEEFKAKSKRFIVGFKFANINQVCLAEEKHAQA